MDSNALVESFMDTVKLSKSHAMARLTKKAADASKVYFEHFQAQNRPKRRSAKIIVEENTTFSAARKYLSGKTAVLNFANPVTPGGGVSVGATAQEECLCRSSNLYMCLKASPFTDYYEYHRSREDLTFSDRLIYTPGVTVFKTDDDIPKLMPKRKWFQVDVITCAAPYDVNYMDRAELKTLFKHRIQNIFEAALDNGVDTLILGAFGCGAFKNPPDVVAAAFHETIEENSYDDLFDYIVFAIKNTVGGDPLTPCPNITAFKLAFDGLSTEANKLRSCGEADF